MNLYYMINDLLDSCSQLLTHINISDEFPINGSPSELTSSPSAEITLSCSFVGNKEPTIQWRRGQNPNYADVSLSHQFTPFSKRSFNVLLILI